MIILSYLFFKYNLKYEKMVLDLVLKPQAQKVEVGEQPQI